MTITKKNNDVKTKLRGKQKSRKQFLAFDFLALGKLYSSTIPVKKKSYESLVQLVYHNKISKENPPFVTIIFNSSLRYASAT